jgi:predicted transcriptional regulator
MELPQEIEVFYTLPAVRRELARLLVNLGLTQRAVGQKLGVTDAAVSQYLSNKRGISVEYPQEIAEAIAAAAKRIKNTEDLAAVRKEITVLSTMMKEHKVICELHKKHGTVKDGCAICYE